MGTSHGRRARLRLRTLIRWLWYFETTPVSPDEILLRRIPNNKSYCYRDRATSALVVDPYAFTPNRKRDTDGMSFYRENFATPEEVALDYPPDGGARVARVAVQLVIDLGLGKIVTDPHDDQERPAGHVYIPALRYVDRKTLSREERQARDRISLALAQHATDNGVFSHPGLSDPV